MAHEIVGHMLSEKTLGLAGIGAPAAHRRANRSGLARRARAAALAVTRTPTFNACVARLETFYPARSGLLTVLTYHRVAEAATSPQLYPGLISASPDAFADQMAFVSQHYDAIGVEDLLQTRRRGRALPGRALLVTFDDAYRDFADHAWPVLRRLGVPVVLFVPTAYAASGAGFWWDRLYDALRRAHERRAAGDGGASVHPFTRFRVAAAEIKALPHPEAMQRVERLISEIDGQPSNGSATLTWNELRALSSEGVILAPHTRNHPRLDRLPAEEARDEIASSLSDLQREIGSVPPVLAYPDGTYDDSTLTAAREAGIEVAFTTRRGTNDLRRPDWLRLRRINVGSRSGVGSLRAQILASAAGAAAKGLLGTGAVDSRLASQ